MTDVAIQSVLSAIQTRALPEAQQLCQRLLDRNPDDSNALFLMAMTLQQQGLVRDAVDCYARLTRLNPTEAVHWLNYANALEVAGSLDRAEDAAREAVRLAPGDADALEDLGSVQLRLNKPLEARETLLRAVGLQPESASICIHAARACAACRDYRAEELLKPWESWLPLEDSLQYELADAKAESGEIMAALWLLEDLVARTPMDLGVRLLLASVYERVNRVDDAETLLDKITARGTEGDDAVACEIAQQRAKLAARRNKPAEALRMLEASGPRHDGDYAYFFLKAKVHDALKDERATISALETAHMRQMDEFKIATPHFFEAGAPALPAATGRLSRGDFQAWPSLKAPDAAESPVFVVGFPRSGTTLLEQMLDAHPHLQSMDERPFFNILASQLETYGIKAPDDLGKLDQRDCDELRKGYLLLACSKVPRQWGARLVDKNPLNMLWLPMIQRLFPRAKFIFALRHPCDVILSCYMQNFRAAPLAVASRSLEHLAHAYVAAMQCWLYHVDIIKPEVLVSRYEDLVADTSMQTRRIAEYLGIESSDSMLEFDRRAREKGYIATPSYTQVIEPVNKKAVNRWHRYREYFQSVLPIVDPMLKHWNYVE